MVRNARRPAGETGRGNGTGMELRCSQSSTTGENAERAIRQIIPRDPGALSLEYHIGSRDTSDLMRDLVAMDHAPTWFDRSLRWRRALTVQALRLRGEL